MYNVLKPIGNTYTCIEFCIILTMWLSYVNSLKWLWFREILSIIRVFVEQDYLLRVINIYQDFRIRDIWESGYLVSGQTPIPKTLDYHLCLFFATTEPILMVASYEQNSMKKKHMYFKEKVFSDRYFHWIFI